MKKETILFFQELFQNSIASKRILSFCKEMQYEELQKQSLFFEENILLSARALQLKKQLELLNEQIALIKAPIEILEIKKKFEVIAEKVQQLSLQSMQNLDQRVFLPDHIDMIFPPFERYAVEKVNRMFFYTLYYAFCLIGLETVKYLKLYGTVKNEEKNEIEEKMKAWKMLLEVVDSQKMPAWMYKQKLLRFDSLGEISQFLYIEENSFTGRMIPGAPEITYEKFDGVDIFLMGISGRGNITNLNPEQKNYSQLISNQLQIYSDTDLNVSNKIIFSLDFNENPIEVLNKYFNKEIFIVSPEAYFRFANFCTILQRTKRILGD